MIGYNPRGRVAGDGRRAVGEYNEKYLAIKRAAVERARAKADVGSHERTGGRLPPNQILTTKFPVLDLGQVAIAFEHLESSLRQSLHENRGVLFQRIDLVLAALDEEDRKGEFVGDVGPIEIA